MSEPVPLPAGFRAAGLHCGVKSDPAKHDLALFVSDRPASAAGVFAQNRVVGWPVVVSRERVPTGALRAVVINSGCANVYTGSEGLDAARRMAAVTAAALDCGDHAVAVCSTGTIAHRLPIEPVAAGIPRAAAALGGTPADLESAARGMMTTDTFPKLATREVEGADGPLRITGVAKGAAMIAPNMATMLAVVMTDAALPPDRCDELLRVAAGRTFNRISVDGHQSTSDTVLLLANGAGGPPADERDFADALGGVCEDLAKSIIRDAEGATHFVTLDVTGLPTEADAHRIARAVADSVLVKTAIHGADPNWGRILSAAGYADVPFDPDRFSLSINGTAVCQRGTITDYDDAALSADLRANRDTHLSLDFGDGEAGVRFWTSDLTAEYVRLNADYTT